MTDLRIALQITRPSRWRLDRFEEAFAAVQRPQLGTGWPVIRLAQARSALSQLPVRQRADGDEALAWGWKSCTRI